MLPAESSEHMRLERNMHFSSMTHFCDDILKIFLWGNQDGVSTCKYFLSYLGFVPLSSVLKASIF